MTFHRSIHFRRGDQTRPKFFQVPYVSGAKILDPDPVLLFMASVLGLQTDTFSKGAKKTFQVYRIFIRIHYYTMPPTSLYTVRRGEFET